MVFKFFSNNGQIILIENANIPLSNIEYSYGFGVYELLKIRDGIVYFEKQHVERLFNSAKVIGLSHSFTGEVVSSYINDLQKAEKIESGNLKVILLGGKTSSDAQLFILPLSPLFPNRKFYTEGVKTITFQYERPYPQAKTLNMLGSFLAFKKAKEKNCYDALLLNSNRNILEGTRTNFFAIKDKTLFTQKSETILEGVTRTTLIHVAGKLGYKIKEENIYLNQLDKYSGAFLTSTSSKILPIKQIDGFVFPTLPENLKLLMNGYNDFLKNSKGIFNPSK